MEEVARIITNKQSIKKVLIKQNFRLPEVLEAILIEVWVEIQLIQGLEH